MQEDNARRIAALMHDISSRLDESVLWVQEESPMDLVEYRRAIGNVLGEIWDRILEPLYKEHPDLKPEELEDDC